MLRHGYYSNFWASGMTRVANPTAEQAAEYYLLALDPDNYEGEFIGKLLNELKKEIAREEESFNPYSEIPSASIYSNAFSRLEVNKLWVEIAKNLILYNYDGTWLLYAKIDGN